MQSATIKWSTRPLPLKIALVKTQMRRCTIAFNKGKISKPVYYDTIDELNSVLGRLRQAEDPLEFWCLRHPSDFECREYDV